MNEKTKFITIPVEEYSYLLFTRTLLDVITHDPQYYSSETLKAVIATVKGDGDQ